ncbi:MAG: hypothetical protein ACI9QN_001025, partial [Arcticibacterium sp.]
MVKTYNTGILVGREIEAPDYPSLQNRVSLKQAV